MGFFFLLSPQRLEAAENQEWEVLKVDADRHVKYYDCCVEPYVNINFNLTIKRRSPMFNSVVVTPASVLILMTLANFWLPPASGEKIILNGVNAIIIVIYLMYFAEQLPVMALNTPLVGESHIILSYNKFI
jgi:nicotinic acetylcholine receptor, invertebrate